MADGTRQRVAARGAQGIGPRLARRPRRGLVPARRPPGQPGASPVPATRPRGTLTAARRLSRRHELVTVLLGLWLMIGLFVDGWAHTNRAQLETFFTPWHALFYSGFAATAAWIAWRIIKEQESGRRGRAAVPLGYGLGLVGVVLFAAGGFGDMLWHMALGVEQNIDALFSPTHLLLFTGIVAILSSPLRAAWSDATDDPRPSLRAFLPVLLSITLATALVSFMFMYFSAFTGNPADQSWVHWAATQSGDGSFEVLSIEEGIARIMATNLILLAPVLLLVRRWRLPFGSVTVLWTTVAVLTSAITEFRFVWLIAAAALGGVAVDTLLRRLRVSSRRPQALWFLGVVAPLPLWSAYFAITALSGGSGWSIELWAGSIVWAALLGGGLAVLCQPPVAPAAMPSGRGRP